MTQSYAIVDLETTGLDCRADKIIEIGCLVVTPDGAQAAESVIVRIDAEVPEHITKITGITQKDVDAGQPLHEALAWLVERCGASEIIVGHNILNFDWDFLIRAEEEACVDLPWTIRQVRDTAVLFLAHRLQWPARDGEDHLTHASWVMARRPRYQKYNLAYACGELGIPVADIQAHRAAGDVTMTHRLYQALLANPVEPVIARAARL